MTNFLTEFSSVFLVSIVLICLLLYFYLLRSKRFFQRYNLKYEIGIPPFGTFVNTIFKNESWMETLRKIYYKYPNEQFIGLCEIGGEPSFMISDPEIIHKILVTDFSSFVNRYYEVNDRTDPLIGHELTNLKTNDWRRVRNTLTPLFTSHKFKEILLPSLIETKLNLLNYLTENLNKNKTIVINVKELSTRSGIESYSLAALGVKFDSLRNNDEGFYNFLDSFLNYIDKSGIEYFSILKFPNLMKNILKRTLVKKTDNTYFKDILINIADSRNGKNFKRNDYLQMIQTERHHNKSVNNDIGKQNVFLFISIRIILRELKFINLIIFIYFRFH